MDEIDNALRVGKEVITHTDNVSVPGWSGAGYIILDPETGDGAYKIGGGANGTFLIIIFTVLLILIAFNPAVAVFFAGFYTAFFLFAIAVATFAVTLDNLDGCGGDVGIGMAVISAVLAAIPSAGQNALVIRTMLEGFIFSGGFASAENGVCKFL